MNTPYTSFCNKCRFGTWYEEEQQCHRNYAKYEICNLGHKHEEEDENGFPIYERCTGTLIVNKK